MQKKLTITVDEAVYAGLYRTVGPRKISRFIEDLVRPLVAPSNLDEAYAEMARDSEREKDAADWVEGTFQEGWNETR